MGMNGWKDPWRLYSKGLRMESFDLSLKDKIISWGMLCMSLILLHFLIIIVQNKVLL